VEIPIEQVIEGSGANIEVVLVHIVELVSVEPIGRPEKWEHEDNVGIRLQSYEETFELGPEIVRQAAMR